MNRAVCLPRFGGPEVLSVERIAIPRPAGDEILVRVKAASLNPVDFKMRRGGYPAVPPERLPIVLGRDLAGTIESLGARGHPTLAAGDAVFAFIANDRGAQADFVVAKGSEVVAMPGALDWVHAAAVPLAAITAWQGLFDHGGLAAGQRVLIHGGAGGVGHLAIQLAKAKGATVFATASAGDLDFVCGLGADTAIDYRNERFEDVANDIDLVFDLVAGETQDRSWAVLRKGGIIVSTLKAPDMDKAAALGMRSAPRYMARPDAGQLAEIAALIEAGKVRVEIARTYPLERVADAHARLEKGGLRGKIVLTLDA
ncbi:MAG: NADP-dependent oxidoreductase [Sphingomonas sp.]